MLDLLAFDYGAGSGRAIVGKFNGKSLSLEEVHRFLNDPVYLGGSLYWDFLRLFHELIQGLKKASMSSKPVSMGIDTWGVDFGLLDTKGKLLGNPLHYRDHSTMGVMDEVFNTISKEEIYQRTGIQFMQFNTLYQLAAMKMNNPAALDRASTLLFIPDLFRYFLTGEKNTEYTIASTSQMMNAKSCQWDNRLIEALGIPVHFLTEIIPSGVIKGKIISSVCSQYDIDPIPVVAVAEHDTASAVMAVPVQKGNFAYLSSGTWSLLGIESSEPVINSKTLGANFTNEGGFGNTIRILKNIMGLWIYQECRREWLEKGENASYDELESAALNCKAFLALIDPDDTEFYSPGSMPDKIRSYLKKTGQPVLQTNAQIVRCIFESLALKYRMALESLEKIAGHPLPVLNVLGGGCKNKVLLQFTANAIKRPVIAGPIEATATGNIIAQLIAMGEIKNLSEGREIIRQSFPVTVFDPEKSDIWDNAYDRFIKLVESREVVK